MSIRRNTAFGIALCLALFWEGPARAQGIAIPNTFVTGTVAQASQVNANFQALANNALNRTGGTMTGTLTTLSLVPTSNGASDLGSASVNYRDLYARTVKLYGATSGSVTFAVPAVAGSSTITFPAGTTDFSATGGTNRFLKQASAGAALTVATIASTDLSDTAALAYLAAANVFTAQQTITSADLVMSIGNGLVTGATRVLTIEGTDQVGINHVLVVNHATNPYLYWNKTAATAQAWALEYTGGTIRFNDVTATKIPLTIVDNPLADAVRIGATSVGIGVAPTGNGFLQVKAGSQTTTLARVGGTMFSTLVGNTATNGAGETDLYTDTIPANTLAVAGDRLDVTYAINFIPDATGSESHQVKVKFGATTVFDSGALTTIDADVHAVVRVRARRNSVTNTVFLVEMHISGAPTATFVVLNTAADSLSSDQELKLTGTVAGGLTTDGQIRTQFEEIEWQPGL